MKKRISKKIRVGIMGFGRIGRDFYRIALNHPEIDIVVISDLGKPEILTYLLQIDDLDKQIYLQNNNLISNSSRTQMIQCVAPSDVSWDTFGVDVVVDTTHKYCLKEQMEDYLDKGVNRVILSNLPKNEIDRIVVMGVNDDECQRNDRLISAGSSTTNAVALMLKIMGDHFKINSVMMTTIHSYTSDQPLQDVVGKDPRRSRSAAENIIPNETPTPNWIGKILPFFENKLDGIALNVPVPKGSCLDLNFLFDETSVTSEDVNNVIIQAEKTLGKYIEVTNDPIVSSDIINNTHSAIFDAKATMKSGKKLIKILCWYDNGLSQAHRILDVISKYENLDKTGELK